MTGYGSPREAYTTRRHEHAVVRARLEIASRRLGTVRIAAFVAALVPWVGAELSRTVPDGVGWLSVPLALVFFVLVGRHRRLTVKLRRVGVAEDLAGDGLARLDRRWADLPEPLPVPAVAGPTHPYAADLDLYGRASLRSLLGPTYTPPGTAALDRWLLEPSALHETRARQDAVRELAALPDVRETAAVEGALLDPVDGAALAQFLDWCVAPTLLPAWAGPVAWVLPAVTAGFVAGDALGLVPGWSWALPLMVQAYLSWTWSRRLHLSCAQASSGVPGLRRYHALLSVWESVAAETGLLGDAVSTLRGPGDRASVALARLERWLQMADARFSSLHPVLAVGVLWDLHVGRGLDAWRASAGQRAAAWMDALGTVEALSALATLAADHPEWAFPELSDASVSPRFQAEALGHPLLDEEGCVRNDVEVGPPGRVLLITGSNMSGKSTLLRSVGLALVLAEAGGPVCARRLQLPVCTLFTSMRVQDSIEAGVSFFMAELQRLAALLRAAPAPDDPGPPLLYLVDEILQGTNSDERRIAGRRLIRHLLRRKAIGAVTTHDLELHRHPEVEAASELVHFRESVTGDAGAESLSFDYRLREGLAETRNALRLAEIVGLSDPDAVGLSE